MKKSIMFSSVSGNTEKLAEIIKNELTDVAYFGKPSEEGLDADIIILGSWTMAFTHSPEWKNLISKIEGKKIFVFMTAGYGSSKEFFEPIISSVKNILAEKNEIIGEFICQAKVSATKQEAIKKMDIDKYNSMKPELDNSQSHPDQNDIENLKKALEILK